MITQGQQGIGQPLSWLTAKGWVWWVLGKPESSCLRLETGYCTFVRGAESGNQGILIK